MDFFEFECDDVVAEDHDEKQKFDYRTPLTRIKFKKKIVLGKKVKINVACNNYYLFYLGISQKRNIIQ